MALGLYVHVPFCASRCAYCDFYSTTQSAKHHVEFAEKVCCELQERCAEAKGRKVSSVYFGGGTPSQLHPDFLAKILTTISSCYVLQSDVEITLEANPDDITPDWIDHIIKLGVNRVSLGIQSFHDERLRLIRRRHTAKEAADAVYMLRDKGINNISIDLIYALPGQTFAEWKQDIQQALSLPVTHLSAYALSYEPSTLLYSWLKSGQIRMTAEALQESMYKYLCKAIRRAGWHHYELSNFCLPGFHSRHNSIYWQSIPYIGVGPGAHSYDGCHSRRSNLPDLKAYLHSKEIPFHIEQLTEENMIDEMLLTHLRTSKGLNLQDVSHRWGSAVVLRLLRAVAPFLRNTCKTKATLQILHAGVRVAPHALFISDALILQVSMRMERLR